MIKYNQGEISLSLWDFNKSTTNDIKNGVKNKTILIILIIIDRPPFPNGMHIVGRWCYTPYTEAI